jgi:uncharacterized membrane protein YkvA (DUF1232 family)
MIAKRKKIRPWMLQKEVLILYYGLRDKRTNALAKLPALLSVIYLISPIDLIPDFIPFFGYLDDLIVVPLLLNLSIKFLPRLVREESILKAARNKRKLQFAFILIILGVLVLLTGIFMGIKYAFFKHP